MANATWKLVDEKSIVVQKSNGDLYFPTSKEIFLSEFKSIFPLKDLTLERPSTCLPYLKFSKIPVQLKLLVSSQMLDSTTILKLDLIVVGQLKEYYAIVTSTDTDYIIADNVWLPFEQGVLEDMIEKLNKAGIFSFGRITLKQYLFLKTEAPNLIDDSRLSFRAGLQQSEAEPDEIPLFSGTLYPYQMQGYKWLKMISQEDAGCILADEMGLGKTAQIIALLSYEKAKTTTPSLVVAPVSLMENWRREVNRFSPELKLIIHQGNNRTGFYKELINYDLVITTYDTVLRDLSLLQMITWNLVVLDEAQAIKNPSAKRSEAIKQIPRRTSIAVTGTPIENKLTDLWSITDFAIPGFLGTLRNFESRFSNDLDGALSLERHVSPIMLRRRVREVADDLPPRIDIPQVMQMGEVDARHYELLRHEIVNEYGKNATLISLIKLRMFCTHPMLQIDYRYDTSHFMKYQRLIEIVEEIMANNEKVLIFTSFTQMIEIMMVDLSERFGVFCEFIDGRVPVADRQPKIDAFSNTSGSSILVLNPRAAGAGLNITSANHVIHYNLEWNPAIEDQASARSFRRGQTRPVNIYRLYYANTVEDVINARLVRKRELSNAVIVGNDGVSSDYTDILNALSMTPVLEG
ncbi:DEAD/DEAH box helicase [Cohnella phaseoli]|uniref:SNF2 family DNA or RNA helicase n=1 Tax=Cohnella phaseoli TaxID=456490 RepID=A0A3D9I860_9BACL|nr:DEAD/DEAH box helicase [Cohnella phaseoli]RED57942.1 SNF2 family DNA or RNA helicase [Cohnella phaseoli]